MRMKPLTISILLVTLAGCAHKPPHATGETQHLFNGKDLGNFYTWLKDRGRDSDPNRVFTVADGLLRISGEEWGCLTTKEDFANYRLVVEYQWGDEAWGDRSKRARDSGVLLHSQGADGAYSGIWMYSIECQMIEGGTGDLLVVADGSDAFAVTCPVAKEMQDTSHVYQPDGDRVTIHKGRINWWGRDPAWQDVIDFRGPRDVEKPIGEWNTLECTADGPRITVKLNGVVVNECLEARPARGKIQVQSEGAELFLRRIDLTPLPE